MKNVLIQEVLYTCRNISDTLRQYKKVKHNKFYTRDERVYRYSSYMDGKKYGFIT